MLHVGNRRRGVRHQATVGAPGVPGLTGKAISPAHSSQLPRKRSNTSGVPFSQRTAAERVTFVVPAAIAEVSGVRIRFI